MTTTFEEKILKVKSIFLSDSHIGARNIECKNLDKFLDTYKAENYFLVGDIIDFWALARKPILKHQHLMILKKLIQLSKKHNMVYILGNHDDFFRKFLSDDLKFGRIEVVNEIVYESKGGKFLVTHGDLYDGIARNHRIMTILGSKGYEYLITLNRLLAKIRKILGMEPWSFSSYVKQKVKKAAMFIGGFEEMLAAECKHRNCDGVICGHIHKAVIKDINGVTYMNCGDFQESSTALVEHHDGSFETIRMETS